MEENIQNLELFLKNNTLFDVEFSEIEKTFFDALAKYSADIIEKIL